MYQWRPADEVFIQARIAILFHTGIEAAIKPRLHGGEDMAAQMHIQEERGPRIEEGLVIAEEQTGSRGVRDIELRIQRAPQARMNRRIRRREVECEKSTPLSAQHTASDSRG